MDPLVVYVDDLASRAGLDNMPDDVKIAMKAAILQQLDNRVKLAIVKVLDEKSLQEYTKMTEAKNPPTKKQIEDFFTSKIPNFKELLDQTAKDFAIEYLNAA